MIARDPMPAATSAPAAADSEPRLTGRRRRARAAAAALAAGGLTSLSVVLLGAPATEATGPEQVVMAQSTAVGSTPSRRPDVILGET